jgi:hypothetical protein
MARDAITLSFQTIECDGCKAWRPRAAQCPDCGAAPQPWEVQIDVARRARIVDECLRAERTRDVATTDWWESLTATPRILRRINKSLQLAATLRAGSDQVLYAFAELDSQINSWRARRPRPHTNQGRILHRALISLRDGYEIFLRSLAAPEPAEAQRLERAGQALLDQATVIINELETLDVAQTNLELPINEYYAYIARETRIADGLPAEVTALDALIQTNSPEAADIASHAIRQMMISLLDLEQGLAVAHATTSLLSDDAGLYVHPAWLREHSRTTSILSASAYALASTGDDSNEFETARLLLEMVKDSREGIIRHALASVLASDPDDYVKLLRSSTGSVIKKASATHPELRLDKNLDPTLRHAVAHSDFDWEDGHFVTHPNGTKIRIDEATFLDGCLAYLETAASLLLGIHHHALNLGHRIDADSHLSKRDRASGLTMALSYLGFGDVHVQLERVTTIVKATGDLERFVMLAGCVATLAPESHTSLKLEISDRDGVVHSCATNLGVVRQFPLTAAGDDQELVTRAAELMSITRVDGLSPWAEDDWLGAGVAVSARREREPLVQAIRRVRRVKALATEAGIPTGNESWNLLLANLRQQTPVVPVSIPAAFRRG